MDIRDWFGLRKTGTAKALALPSTLLIATQLKSTKICVVLHLYYVDLISEFAAYLKNIPVAFDLLVSTDTDVKKKIILESEFSNICANLTVKIVPNRGRDIAPKLIAFADHYHNYDALLFIHSKKSLHNKFHNKWRELALSQLLGSKQIVCNILALFQYVPNLGIAAPAHFDGVAKSIGWAGNKTGSAALAKRMGIIVDAGSKIDFPSGSMFWARPSAIGPLLALKLSYQDFESENGQTDQTLAHHIERLFYLVCKKAGYSWIVFGQPSHYRNRRQFGRISTRNLLQDFLRQDF